MSYLNTHALRHLAALTLLLALVACTDSTTTQSTPSGDGATNGSTGGISSSSGGTNGSSNTPSTPPATTPPVSGKIIDNEDKTPSLKGIDANGNGIRDDIDRLIALKYAGTPEIKKAAEQKARALQRNMEASTRAEALRAGDAIKRAARCAYKVLPHNTREQVQYRESMSKDMVALTVNTEDRFKSYWKANSLMNGAVFQQPSEPVCD